MPVRLVRDRVAKSQGAEITQRIGAESFEQFSTAAFAIGVMGVTQRIRASRDRAGSAAMGKRSARSGRVQVRS